MPHPSNAKLMSLLIGALRQEQADGSELFSPAEVAELQNLLERRHRFTNSENTSAGSAAQSHTAARSGDQVSQAESTLIGALPDAAGIFGPSARLELSNSMLNSLAPNGRATGMTALELSRSAELSTAVRAALGGRGKRFELTLPGRRRTFLVYLAPLGSGRALMALRDLTESKLMEAARRDFVANASHELRTPVTAIGGAAETLLAGAMDDPEEARRFVEMIARHADRLSRLTQDLLDLSRVETGERSMDIQPLELFDFAQNVLEFFSSRAEEQSVDLHSEIPEGIQVLADSHSLEQSLVNLVDNALKFTPAHGSITLSAEEKDGFGIISVSDTGPGIERHHLPRIFERFYRADPGRARAAGGDGLGLAIVKHLMQAQAGEAGVESSQEGSRFWLRLPLKKGDRTAPASEKSR